MRFNSKNAFYLCCEEKKEYCTDFIILILPQRFLSLLFYFILTYKYTAYSIHVLFLSFSKLFYCNNYIKYKNYNGYNNMSIILSSLSAILV